MSCELYSPSSVSISQYPFMSGHSKWHSIKHKKGAADAKRGKIFTRHAKLIQIAAREGGSSDPDMNAALKVAIDNAKADNVPNNNIERAAKKGAGETGGEQMAEIVYECYGPGGVACIIECLTDNKNRTLSNVKSIIEKSGGKWAESGSVTFLFARKGVVVASLSNSDSSSNSKSEELELALIDLGAEEIDISDDIVSVTTDASSWTKVRDYLKEQGIEVQESGLKYVAKQKADLADAESAKKLMNFIEGIEEDDDVSEVHTNADMSEEIAAALSG